MKEVASEWRVPAGSLVMAGGMVASHKGKSLNFKQAARTMRTETVSATAMRSPEYGKRGMMFLGGVQFAEVAVDTETGIIRVERVLAVHDCGRPINLLALESQVNGGILQGISYALYEDRRLDRNTGIMVNPNLEEYKIIGPKDMPQIEVVLIDRKDLPSAGAGETGIVAVAPAVGNAIFAATGERLRAMPMARERS